ncbi:hypothetical protein AB1Y20_011996 [Prymnesium parvum]|uniref:Mutator-like transposase domain-containing protein n=1 Tax=Prymnesium parvum TaxID=97485 RepID=A0AB34IPN3_PRYPA
MLTLKRGVAPSEKGEVPVSIAYDAQWMKPGKAMNSAEGYGEAIGSLSRKCVMTAHRSKVGPLANHRGSSGSMEPLMGAEIVTKLNTEENGVYVGCLCMDLDAKTPKAVAAAVKDTAYAPPKREHDPNHYVKAIRKRFIDVKKKIKFPNVFPPATQKKLGDEVALAVHQHRGSNGSKEKLRGAILNVVDHAFNNHLRCREFFACPCAPDAHGVIKRTISSYKNGEWLDLAGGDKERAAKLKQLLKCEFVSATSEAHVSALCHDNNTQVQRRVVHFNLGCSAALWC